MNITFDDSLEFLLKINNEDDAQMYVGSTYDPFFLFNQDKTTVDPTWWQQRTVFNVQRVPISYQYAVKCQTHPFKALETGRFVRGNTNPTANDYNDLADWYSVNQTLEIRIPWMLLGFMDPSKRQVWAYPVHDNPYLVALTSQQMRIQFVSVKNTTVQRYYPQLLYTPEMWYQRPIDYYPRKKASFSMMQQALVQIRARSPPSCVPRGGCQTTVLPCPDNTTGVTDGGSACGVGCIIGVSFGALFGSALLVFGAIAAFVLVRRRILSVDYQVKQMTQLKGTPSKTPKRQVKKILKSHTKSARASPSPSATPLPPPSKTNNFFPNQKASNYSSPNYLASPTGSSTAVSPSTSAPSSPVVPLVPSPPPSKQPLVPEEPLSPKINEAPTRPTTSEAVARTMLPVELFPPNTPDNPRMYSAFL